MTKMRIVVPGVYMAALVGFTSTTPEKCSVVNVYFLVKENPDELFFK